MAELLAHTMMRGRSVIGFGITGYGHKGLAAPSVNFPDEPGSFCQLNTVHGCVQISVLAARLREQNFEGIAMNTRLSRLPIEKRIRLVEELWDSIAADQKVLLLTVEQKAELDRRLDAYEADRNQGRLAGESISDIRRKR